MTLTTETVTFLLTDIEGSARLWEQYPEAMRGALARHDALAEAVVTRHWGRLLKSRGEGDSLFIVFAEATAAVHAACALQQAFHAEPWPEEIALCVRMALHTGEAQRGEGDYYGPTVNRCARLRALARGGQVLLSDAIQALVCAALPPGASLQDMGEHPLRDLQQPEHVWQLRHPGFPPPRTLPVPQHNLPQQITSFIGREKEIAEIGRLLSTTRLLTLAGMGGLGKTRLAVRVAEEALGDYPDGVWLVELAPLSDPALVPQTIAMELGVREEAGRSLVQALADYLKPRTLLLILDNCEHLLTACARLADTLLRACPDLRLLASSREALSIAGETIYRVPPLSLPDPKRLPSLMTLLENEAVRLFVERAGAASPSFALTERNALAVCQVCHRIDGIPLALELAAARVKSLPVEQIAERLADRFRLLTGGSRTALPRQQTLRAMLDWSYDLLSEEERELFHRLSVFVGGFSLEAAEEVCADRDEGGKLKDDFPLLPTKTLLLHPADILDLLAQLVDKSLLIADEAEGRVRYRMLETLRQYSQEKLIEAGLSEIFQKRHLAYFLGVAEIAERKLRGSEQSWWLEHLDAEHDNLRAALDRPAETEAEAEAGLKLAGALWWFWHVRGYFAEGREWLRAKLAAFSRRTRDRAKTLHGAAVLAQNQGDYAAARSLSQESLEIKRELGDRQGIAASLNNLAALALAQGDYAAARPFYEESLQTERELGNRQGITASLIGLGNVALEQGDYDAAQRLYEESLSLKRELGDKRGVAASLTGLGNVALAQADTDRAQALHAESLAIRRHLQDRRGIATSLQYLASLATALGDLDAAAEMLAENLAIRRELGDKLGIGSALYGQGLVALKREDTASACALLTQSLTIFRELENRRGIAHALNALAYLAVTQARPERAARLFGAAEAVREAIGSPLPPNERPDYEQNLAIARAALGEETFAAERAQGRALPREQALNDALECL